MKDSNGFQVWRTGTGKAQRTYALKIGGKSYDLWRQRLAKLSAEAQLTGDWSAYQDAQDQLLRTHGRAAEGYHLPPGTELPQGWCFGLGNRLEKMPVEKQPPAGSCWDDDLPEGTPEVPARWQRPHNS